ncbi:hypothetical protein NEOLEDRAFT_1133025 [Neolentinus lepideus HHB14362 ss-1]|uniref:mRNA export factor GLE1 n=1 Tax=Neolentinus lepideus HHB14362 ss-1 TaxID=1314782 RepID=A0A165T0P5_9AGAM|nr:hypothetical protein NEOLEDRAFT_1133025 [Neolentinus lepideus HHB14362 ss-1]
MRIRAPRSDSPSPVRRVVRQRHKFRLPKDGVYYDSETSISDSESESSSSSSSTSCDPVPEEDLPVAKPSNVRSEEELRATEAAVNSIWLLTRYPDPYEEWEKKAKEEALLSARKEYASLRKRRHTAEDAARAERAKQLEVSHKKEMEEVEARLAGLRLRQKTEEEKLREDWKVRDKQLWDKIEAVIKAEENKVKAKLDAELRAKEEEEKKRKEEEERKKQEEERKLKEAEEARLKKEREEEEARQQKEREEEQRRKEDELQKAQTERLKQEEQERKAIGMTTAEDDWRSARDSLKRLKNGPMKTVKSTKELKSAWGKIRREITPKIGQLTNDARAIDRICHELVNLIRPVQQQSADLYYACLSSLAKAILMQAETEVTAEKRSAGPLVQVTVNMLSALESFGDIFWAKLCQRAGGWPIPTVVPTVDVDGLAFTEETRKKVMGYRVEETQAEFNARLGGIMRVYFAVLFAPVQNPLGRPFQLPRYWMYFVRLLSTPHLLSSAVAPAVLQIALDVCGLEAKYVFGHQWIKMLELLYEGVTTGLMGSSDLVLGGSSPEGTAARVRVQLEIERIMNSS